MKKIVAGIGAAVLASCGLLGQTAPPPAFEVASFKLVDPKSTTSAGRVIIGRGATQVRDPGRISYERISLRSLVTLAYEVMPYQLLGPDWWGSAFYKLEAVIPPHTPDGRVPVMMQALLEERLHLKVHRERKDMPVYAVVVASKGLRLHKAQTDPSTELDSAGRPKPLSMTSATRTEKRISGTLSIPVLLGKLTADLDRPMVDMTGLDGKYEIDLAWEFVLAQPISIAEPDGGDVRAEPPGPSSLFSAMEKQLGLKVEARKAPVEVLVVDHVERVPTEN